MLSVSETLYLSVNFQLLLTLFLVGLLWDFYYRLQRFDFFRWWAWAWTALALFLGSATISLRLGATWTPMKFVLVFFLLFAGFAQPLLLICGGLSWTSPDRPSRRSFWAGGLLVLVATIIGLLLGFSIAPHRTLASPFATFPVRSR